MSSIPMHALPSQSRTREDPTGGDTPRLPAPWNRPTLETFSTSATRPLHETFETYPVSPTLPTQGPYQTYTNMPTSPLYSRSAGQPAVTGTDTFDPRTVASAPDADPHWAPHMVPVGDFLAPPTILHPHDPRLAAAQTLLSGNGPTIGSAFGSGHLHSGGSPYAPSAGADPQQQGGNPEAAGGGTPRQGGCWSRRSTCGKWTIALSVIVAVGVGSAIAGVFASRGSGSKEGNSAGSDGTSPSATSTDTSAPPRASAAGVLAANSYPISVSKSFDNCTVYGLACGDAILSGTWTFDRTSGGGYAFTGADGYKSSVQVTKDAAGRSHLVFDMASDVSFTWNDAGSSCTARESLKGVVVPHSPTTFDAEVGRLMDLCGEQAGSACLCWWKGYQA
ncbi:MAG TPA: hypothetical protein VFH51_05840 [Myxococcota bacterium]|nr:hypothetical protein [Myxococcota bacterium]